MSYLANQKTRPPECSLATIKIFGMLPIGRAAMSSPAETVYPTLQVPIAPDRRRQDRVITRLPIRILAVNGNPTCHNATCTNLSRGGIGFDTSVRLEVGKVIEIEFVQVVDEAVRYWIRILFRDNSRYGGYYVNDDGTDIRPAN